MNTDFDDAIAKAKEAQSAVTSYEHEKAYVNGREHADTIDNLPVNIGGNLLELNPRDTIKLLSLSEERQKGTLIYSSSKLVRATFAGITSANLTQGLKEQNAEKVTKAITAMSLLGLTNEPIFVYKLFKAFESSELRQVFAKGDVNLLELLVNNGMLEPEHHEYLGINPIVSQGGKVYHFPSQLGTVYASLRKRAHRIAKLKSEMDQYIAAKEDPIPDLAELPTKDFDGGFAEYKAVSDIDPHASVLYIKLKTTKKNKLTWFKKIAKYPEQTITPRIIDPRRQEICEIVDGYRAKEFTLQVVDEWEEGKLYAAYNKMLDAIIEDQSTGYLIPQAFACYSISAKSSEAMAKNEFDRKGKTILAMKHHLVDSIETSKKKYIFAEV